MASLEAASRTRQGKSSKSVQDVTCGKPVFYKVERETEGVRHDALYFRMHANATDYVASCVQGECPYTTGLRMSRVTRGDIKGIWDGLVSGKLKTDD